MFKTGGKLEGPINTDWRGPLDLGKGDRAEPILDFRPGTLRWSAFRPDEQDRPRFELHLQFSIHAGFAVILHFPLKSLIGGSTAKMAADNRAFDFIPAAGPVFHKAPPFVRY